MNRACIARDLWSFSNKLKLASVMYEASQPDANKVLSIRLIAAANAVLPGCRSVCIRTFGRARLPMNPFTDAWDVLQTLHHTVTASYGRHMQSDP